MNLENAVYPTGQQIAALMAADDGKPIMMLNLLKFRERAEYKDGRADGGTGREAYMRYGLLMTEFVLSKGGRIQFTADVKSLVIGEVGELWDMAAIMEYPSAKAFVEIATSPQVAEFGLHREAGLAGQLLIMCATR